MASYPNQQLIRIYRRNLLGSAEGKFAKDVKYPKTDRIIPFITSHAQQ